uniref:60S ribosome subunit biogenesis protein NIP7 homolog n=19 Tax=Passeriformes TaxID=9126 RepID=A0A8C3NNK8_9PASS
MPFLSRFHPPLPVPGARPAPAGVLQRGQPLQQAAEAALDAAEAPAGAAGALGGADEGTVVLEGEPARLGPDPRPLRRQARRFPAQLRQPQRRQLRHISGELGAAGRRRAAQPGQQPRLLRCRRHRRGRRVTSGPAGSGSATSATAGSGLVTSGPGGPACAAREMRPLTEAETRAVFEKLGKYIGENIQLLVDRPDGTYCFRLHRDRVYYLSEKLLKLAASVPRDSLVAPGTCFGKFTKSQKFRLSVTALDFLAPYAKYKVWVKPGSEQSFLYGNHVLKSGLGRITENTAQYQGVVVYSMADVPLGFGVAAKSTQECRKVDPLAIVVFHQADVGEYVRNEDTLT